MNGLPDQQKIDNEIEMNQFGPHPGNMLTGIGKAI
jgi:hypothetical protein